MTGNVKVTMKKKMGICIWVGCMILIVAALCLCLMAVGRDSVYITEPSYSIPGTARRHF